MNRVNLTNASSLAIVLASLAACSRAGAPFVPSAGYATLTSEYAREGASSGFIAVDVDIPKSTAPAMPRFVSPSTKSMQIKIYNQAHTKLLATKSANLTATSTGCKAGSRGLACKEVFDAPAGSDTFDVTLFDRTGAAGNALSALNKFPKTVVAGKTATLSIVLGGLAASIDVIAAPGAGISGTQSAGYTIVGSQPQAFTIVPKDADGNYIVGPGAPAITIVARPADTIVGTPPPASPNVWTIASTYASTNPLTPENARMTIRCVPVPGSGGTTVNASVKLALFQPWIYVMNDTSSGHVVTAYDEAGDAKTLTGTFPGLTQAGFGVFSPRNDSLYIAQYTSVSHIAAFDVMGNARTLKGTFPNSVYPGQIALDTANGQIYIPNYQGGSTGAVTAYDLQGQQVPLGVDAFKNMWNGAFVMTYVPDNDTLYGINYSSSNMSGYNAEGSVKASGFPGLDYPYAATYDSKNGQLYVANDTTYAVKTVTSYDLQGAEKTLSGNFSGLYETTGIAYDPYNDRLYVSSNLSGNGEIVEIDDRANAQKLKAGAFSGVTYPYGIVIVP